MLNKKYDTWLSHGFKKQMNRKGLLKKWTTIEFSQKRKKMFALNNVIL